MIYLLATACYLIALIKNKVNVAKLGRAFIADGACRAHCVVGGYYRGYRKAAISQPVRVYAVVYVGGCRGLCCDGVANEEHRVWWVLVPLIAAFVYFTQRLPNGKIDDNIMPALRSAWRVPHIASAILAYGAFLIAFMLAIMYLTERESMRGWLRTLAKPAVDRFGRPYLHESHHFGPAGFRPPRCLTRRSTALLHSAS